MKSMARLAAAVQVLALAAASGGAQANRDSEAAFLSQVAQVGGVLGPAGRFMPAAPVLPPAIPVQGVPIPGAAAGQTPVSEEESRVRVVQAAKRAVVRVSDAEGHGTGFVIDPLGLVVTNAHVVEGDVVGDRVGVEPADPSVFPEASKKLKARVLAVGDKEARDLAFLQIESDKRDWPTLELGVVKRRTGAKDRDGRDVEESVVHEGQTVFALGYPHDYPFNVTQGVISGVARDEESDFASFLLTSAAINPGNSGGPLLALDGKVIGVNTLVDTSAQNIGLSISVDEVRLALEQFRRIGNIDSGSLRAFVQLEKGRLVVRQIMPGGAAAKAGLRLGDVIVEIDGIALSGEKADGALARHLRRKAPGDSATVTVTRGGRTLRLPVVLDKYVEPPAQKMAVLRTSQVPV